MKSLAIATAFSLTSAASSTAVQPSGTPFCPGFDGLLVISTDGMTGGTSPSFKVEGSADGTTYTALATITAQGPVQFVNISIPKYLRVTVTSVSTGGKVTAALLGNV